MPNKFQASSRRRTRKGGLFAVVLLLVCIGGLFWLWWNDSQPEKTSRPKPAARQQPKVQPLPQPPRQQPRPQPPAQPQPVRPVIPIQQTNPPSGFPRPARDAFEAQVALVRRGISPGSIDANVGSQTRAAIAAFQRMAKIPETSALDTNTRALLMLETPVLATRIVTSNDVARLQPVGKTWLEKSLQSALEYETILELVAEKAHSHPALIRRLNPEIVWTNLVAGDAVKIPDVSYPAPPVKASRVLIHLSGRYLEAFDAETNLLAHFPCSIAARFDKRPIGELRVKAVAPNPNYTFDPAVFPESAEAQAMNGKKLILQPGPNNPVGAAWIGLDKPGYGIHGTPSPEQVGRTESHGCFRLANWDAEYLVKLAWVGLPVEVVP